MRLRSPITWYGGKGLMTKKLLGLVPAHKIYVEAFGGGASLLFAKRPAKNEVYNDANKGLVNFMRLLRSGKDVERLLEMLEKTPYSRFEYECCASEWQDIADPVVRAWAWYTATWMNIVAGKGGGGGWRHSRAKSSATRFRSAIQRLQECSERLRLVQVDCVDGVRLLETWDTPDTFFYLDPPYNPETRSGSRYEIDFSREQHERLVQKLLGIHGMAMLSGYRGNGEAYAALEKAGWLRTEWGVICHSIVASRNTAPKPRRVEVVWRNYRLVRDRHLSFVDKECGKRLHVRRIRGGVEYGVV